jgi:thiosulfate/3-mercaptopyruvate sulfurtransferase
VYLDWGKMTEEVDFSTLIRIGVLKKNLDNPNWVVVDCRFNLQDPNFGYQDYKNAHITGAIYAHLEDDLCGGPVTDNGRHPLPSADEMSILFGNMGIDADKQVIVYDHSSGAIAARLWWMLRFMGHTAVAVLDGGWDAWQRAGFPHSKGVDQNKPAHFDGQPRKEWLVTMDEVATLPLLVDSRSPERHRGEMEPIDPVAGHIPGSLNYYYQRNWDDEGFFLPADELREKFSKFLGDAQIKDVTFYCGSGVTACVNLLALEHAGLGSARLYVGSWGEWCRNTELPVASGG